MTVITTADRKIEAALLDVQSAIQNLEVAFNPNTWGSEEYTTNYKKKMSKFKFKLEKMGLKWMSA